MFDRRLILDPQVALRPEPFGALAYHYGNRKLIFLRHPDMARVVQFIRANEDDAITVAEALRSCAVEESRWPSFERAFNALIDSEMLHEHTPAPTG